MKFLKSLLTSNVKLKSSYLYLYNVFNAMMEVNIWIVDLNFFSKKVSFIICQVHTLLNKIKLLNECIKLSFIVFVLCSFKHLYHRSFGLKLVWHLYILLIVFPMPHFIFISLWVSISCKSYQKIYLKHVL
jgi:hypothetical protein